MKKKAFTLIELIAVLVILAILALIVTPLVMSIIRKAKISADKRSVDAYGRPVELAIANYLLDNGDFPTDISHLTIEYTGDEVVCSTSKLNSDSSVYLAGCTVAGRNVDYTYGKEVITYDTYEVGDEVTYNSIKYYVIKDSDTTEDSVTLLKAEPLTVDEVNTYGVGHINRYAYDSVGTVYDKKGYGGMAYYTSETCGRINNDWVFDGCTTDYEQSEVKYVVDAWAANQAPAATEARLIQYDELIDNLGYNYATLNGTSWIVNSEYTPRWVYNINYEYWTMSSYNNSKFDVWRVRSDGNLSSNHINYYFLYYGNYHGVVRPVIILNKKFIED